MEFAKLMQNNGAEELIIQSIDRDGKMNDYHLNLIDSIAKSVTIPVI